MSIAAPYKALLTLLLSRIALTMNFISCYVYRCSTSKPTYATASPECLIMTKLLLLRLLLL